MLRARNAWPWMEDRVVGARFSRVFRGRRYVAVGRVFTSSIERRVCTRRGDGIAGRVRPDASVGDHGGLGARRPQRDRATMSADGREPDSRTVPQS